jgi:DNA modification methylase
MINTIEIPIQPENLSPESILELFKAKCIDKEWSFAESKPSDTSKWTHGYHRYPAKFIPQLVERLVVEYVSGRDVHINDPFMGCGTTIVTAISKGFLASGTDINKIAGLITKVKSTPLEPNYLDKKIQLLLSKLSFLDIASVSLFGAIEPLIPVKHLEKINYWFTAANKTELGVILQAIHDEDDKDIRDFFLVAFSHILKNCSIWLQGSTKPTRDFNKKLVKPYAIFRRHLNKMQQGNEAFFNMVPVKIRQSLSTRLNIKNGDARQQPVANSSVDLIVTSSPYVTSYEYADLHQLSTLWLDLSDNLSEYRQAFIGTAHKKYHEKQAQSAIAQHIVSQMSLVNKKMASEINAYFIDMQEVFNESYRILKSGGRCCYVIGNTQLKGIEILNAEVFVESLQQSGFVVDRIIKRAIPSKILPQARDDKTGRFASANKANWDAYPIEYIVVGLKE